MGGEGSKSVPKTLEVTMPDGSVYGVPVVLIARNRAEIYKSDFGEDIERSMSEDTMPLFAESEYAIKDWAANNMNWSDVEASAKLLSSPEKLTAADMQGAWVNGDKNLSDRGEF